MSHAGKKWTDAIDGKAIFNNWVSDALPNPVKAVLAILFAAFVYMIVALLDHLSVTWIAISGLATCACLSVCLAAIVVIRREINSPILLPATDPSQGEKIAELEGALLRASQDVAANQKALRELQQNRASYAERLRETKDVLQQQLDDAPKEFSLDLMAAWVAQSNHLLDRIGLNRLPHYVEQHRSDQSNREAFAMNVSYLRTTRLKLTEQQVANW